MDTVSGGCAVDPLHQMASVGRQALTNLTRFADRPAICDGSTSLSYRQLGDMTARLISVLKQAGLRRGNALAILAGNRAEVLAAMLAANLMGMRYTPLHPLAALEDQRFIIADAEIDSLIVDPQKFGARALEIRAGVPHLRHLLTLGPLSGGVDLLEGMRHARPAPLIDESDPQAPAFVIYTGGTTGKSKGALHTHRSIQTATLLMACEWEWPSEIRFLAATPISHAAGGMLRPVMYRGGYTRLLHGFDPEVFCRTIQEERITCTLLVPTILYALIDSPARHRYDLSSLQMIVYGAAPMSPDRLRQAIEVFGPIFVQLYGQTEAPQCIATLRKADHDLTRPERLVSCGLPSAGLDVRLFDSNMKEVPVGSPGEICVRGPLVMEGYWKRPEATAEVFHGGWLHTGDVAVRDNEGYLTIVDRTKDLIITGGVNVYPREVEDALMSHPAVASAAVIGIPDPKWGEAVMAFVVLQKGAAVELDSLRRHVKERKGGPWTPKTIEFVDQLPLTGLGKIDRKALRARFWPSDARQVS